MSEYTEKYGPIFCSLCFLVFLFACKDNLIELSESHRIDITALYSSVFDWASIQTGFLFGIFGYVSGKSSVFVTKIQKSNTIKEFNRYMLTSIALGFIMTLSSIFFVVTKLNISSDDSVNYIIFSLWSFLSVWGFLSFARVAYIFGVMIKIKDKDRFPG